MANQGICSLTDFGSTGRIKHLDIASGHCFVFTKSLQLIDEHCGNRVHGMQPNCIKIYFHRLARGYEFEAVVKWFADRVIRNSVGNGHLGKFCMIPTKAKLLLKMLKLKGAYWYFVANRF